MKHICVNNLTIIGSDNVLSPGRRQAIIWTNAGILLIGPLGTNFNEIHTFLSTKIHLKMSSGKWRPFVSASMWYYMNYINNWMHSWSCTRKCSSEYVLMHMTPLRYCRHFAGGIFTSISLYENYDILIQISAKCATNNDKPTLVKMIWWLCTEKATSHCLNQVQPSLLKHICIASLM